MDIEYVSIIIGVVTVTINIWVAIYNVGKNRIIYDVEEHMINKDGDENYRRTIGDLKNKLSREEYTILSVYPNLADGWKKSNIYVLGRIKK